MRKPSKKVLSIILALYLGLASYLFTVIIKYINPSINPTIDILFILFYPVCAILVLFYLISSMTGWRPTLYGLRKDPDAKDSSFEDSLEKSSILRKQSVDSIICYNCKDVFIEKENVCDACAAELYQRDDDKEDVIRQRLDSYKEKTQPLINYYKEKGLLVDIDGTGAIDRVFSDICKILDQYK